MIELNAQSMHLVGLLSSEKWNVRVYFSGEKKRSKMWIGAKGGQFSLRFT
jgi:hypothetical protein